MKPVIWITGAPGSGKTTLATKILCKLRRPVHLVDGDLLRQEYGNDLSWTAQDRQTQMLRAVEKCDVDRVTVVSLVSPFNGLREIARDLIGPERFFLVYCHANRLILRARRPKLYDAVEEGTLTDWFEHEPPENPDVTCDTGISTVSYTVPTVMRAFWDRFNGSLLEDDAHES
jgi:adenylylsulfate kinase-like enzyme